MKLLHLGDLHLGKSLLDFSLIDDQRFILDRIIDIVDSRKVDAVLIAGDVYDRKMPSEEAVKLLDEFICKLVSRRVKTFMISGNHDSDVRLDFGSTLFAKNDVFIASRFDGRLFMKELSDGHDTVNICLLPFVRASFVREYYPEAKIDTYEDAVRTVIESADIDVNKTNILVAHQFVAGKGGAAVLSGSETSAASSVGTVEQIGTSCFDCFDYVALGHIHGPQKLDRETLRYSGSPLKYSLTEADNKKSVPLITVTEGNVEVELIPLQPMRDLRHIKGKLAQLLDSRVLEALRQESAAGTRQGCETEQAGAAGEDAATTDTAAGDPFKDFIYVTLTDEDVVNDAMGIFRQVYPFTLRIDYDNSHTREIENVDLSKLGENRPFDELIAEFYQNMYGCEISDEEMKLMCEVARKAGVLDEAD